MSDVAPTPAGDWSLMGSLIFAAVWFGANEAYHWWVQPRRPFTKAYQKDLVHVYQFPRTPVIPSLSAHCLALETWLRFANIKYHNVVGPAWFRSKEADIVPFVEINGLEYSSTNDVILHLSQTRQRTDLEASVETDSVKKIEKNIDDLMWCYFYFRYVKNEKVLFSKPIIGKNSVTTPVMPGCSQVFIRQILKNSCAYRWANGQELAKLVSNRMKEILKSKGFPRLLELEILDRAEGHLKYLANAIGTKPYIFGNKVSSTDCILFGTMAQIVYVPYKTPLKRMLRKDYKVLTDHCERMKKNFWQDWEKVLVTGKMNTAYLDDDDDD